MSSQQYWRLWCCSSLCDTTVAGEAQPLSPVMVLGLPSLSMAEIALDLVKAHSAPYHRSTAPSGGATATQPVRMCCSEAPLPKCYMNSITSFRDQQRRCQ